MQATEGGLCPPLSRLKGKNHGMGFVHGVRGDGDRGVCCGRVLQFMMREYKLYAWLIVGMLLGGWATWASAETVMETCDATTCTRPADNSGNVIKYRCSTGADGNGGFGAWFSTEAAACSASGGLLRDPPGSDLNKGCWETSNLNYPAFKYNCVSGTVPEYTCPSGQGWNLTGSTCSRPACPLGRNPDGTCAACATMQLSDGSCAEPCQAGQEITQFNKTSVVDTAKTYCGPNNCSKTVVSRTPVATGCTYGSGGVGLCQTGYHVTLKSTGAYCDYEAGGNPNTNPPEPDNNDSPCPAGNGVVTSAGGFLRCLPPGTGDSEEYKKTETETKPGDGTPPTTETKETNTNTICTGEGSCTTTTTTTVTNSGGTTSTTETTEQSKTAFCANNPKDAACTGAGTVQPDGTIGDGTPEGCDPTVQMCGSGAGTGGLYAKKEKTMKEVIQAFGNGFKVSPVGSAMTGYFNVTVAGGACPAWSGNIPYFETHIDVGQYFCNGSAESMMSIVGNVLMVLAAFVGFKWAVL